VSITFGVISVTFPEKLRLARESVDMSQKDLANESGVSQQAIASYELGTRNPNWAAVQALANALGISCNDLTDDPKQAGKRKSS
jgi:transcriptional regulator with XRE-family HTH domain